MSDEVVHEIKLTGERLLQLYEGREIEVEGKKVIAAVVIFLGDNCFTQWINCSQEEAGEFVRSLLKEPINRVVMREQMQ